MYICMEPRHCTYCKYPATYSPIDKMEVYGIKIFFCHPCQAEYLYFSKKDIPSEKPSSVSLYAVVKEKMFRWTITADGNVCLWKVGSPGIPGVKINENMESIAFIQDLQTTTVTPQNIRSKLEKWLPFL